MNDNTNEWMLGEAQLYIHAESTALVMLPASTLKMLERVVRATAKAWQVRGRERDLGRMLEHGRTLGCRRYRSFI